MRREERPDTFPGNGMTRQHDQTPNAPAGVQLSESLRVWHEPPTIEEAVRAVVDADADSLARRIESLLEAGAVPRRLSDLGVTGAEIPALAAAAAQQWTAAFNPRPMNDAGFRELYESAL